MRTGLLLVRAGSFFSVTCRKRKASSANRPAAWGVLRRCESSAAAARRTAPSSRGEPVGGLLADAAIDIECQTHTTHTHTHTLVVGGADVDLATTS